MSDGLAVTPGTGAILDTRESGGVHTPRHMEDATQRAALLTILNGLATATGQTAANSALAQIFGAVDGVEGALASILGKISADPATATLQGAHSTLLTNIFNKMVAGPATETTLASVLSALTTGVPIISGSDAAQTIDVDVALTSAVYADKIQLGAMIPLANASRAANGGGIIREIRLLFPAALDANALISLQLFNAPLQIAGSDTVQWDGANKNNGDYKFQIGQFTLPEWQFSKNTTFGAIENLAKQFKCKGTSGAARNLYMIATASPQGGLTGIDLTAAGANLMTVSVDIEWM